MARPLPPPPFNSWQLVEDFFAASLSRLYLVGRFFPFGNITVFQEVLALYSNWQYELILLGHIVGAWGFRDCFVVLGGRI